MGVGSFVIETLDTHTFWAEVEGGKVVVHRASHTSNEEDHVLLRWDTDVLRNLLSWASGEGDITTHFTGPMAHQIRQHSKELGMTPEMFVWHGVKVFIEVGSGP